VGEAVSFLSGGAKSAGTKPNYTGVQIQTAINTLPIPVGWGRFRIAPNLLWYNNFQQHAVKQKGGGKGLGGGSSTSYTYTADIIMGLCEGPISSIGQIWVDSTIYNGLSSLGLSLFVGNTPQAGWSYLFSKYPAQALTYPGTAYVCAASYSLGSSASLPNHNYEVSTPLAGTGINGVDADPALVMDDAFFNQQYGFRYPAGSVNLATIFSSANATTTGDASLQTYCKAQGIAFSPLLINVETAQSVVQRWIKLLNCAVVDSGGVLQFIPFGDQPITANGFTYLPNMTPIFNLGDGDFQGDSSADPVQGQITDPSEAYNVERLTINDRTNAYNATPYEARDEAMVNQYGLRVDTSVAATEICDPNVAAVCAQLVLQRQLYVRNTHIIKLDPRYCGLDPMDIVTLTDPAMGMNNASVRIMQIEEDDNGILTCTVEELPAGVGTAALYTKQSNGSGGNTLFATANPVNPPVIFEPPPALTGNQAQVWVAASGSVGGVADPLWGGAQVYISLDNATYEYVGSITAPARQGALMAALAAYNGVGPDGETLAVDLTMSGGVLVNASSAASAAAGNTMCYVDGEIISYVTATLTGTEQYALTTLYRGQYGTVPGAHAQGAAFARLDGAVFVYDLPTEYVGQTIYIKLASFNGQGGGLQSLTDCTAYTYTPTGAGLFGPIANALQLGQSLDYGQVTGVVTLADIFGSVTDPVNLPVDLGVA
jgi:hypothetical protein